MPSRSIALRMAFTWPHGMVVALAVGYYFVPGVFLLTVKANWPWRFVRELVLPNYITNWCVWIPVMMAVYAFPLTLQIHLGGFAGAFWSLVFLYMGARRDGLRGVIDHAPVPSHRHSAVCRRAWQQSPCDFRGGDEVCVGLWFQTGGGSRQSKFSLPTGFCGDSRAFYLYFYGSGADVSNSDRSYGLSVRAVRDAE